MIRELVLVAGTDYPHYEEVEHSKRIWKLGPRASTDADLSRGRFRGYCERWALRQAAQLSGDEQLRMTIFDFSKGVRESWISNRLGLRTHATQFKYLGINAGDYFRVAGPPPGTLSPLTPTVTRSPSEIDPPHVGLFPGVSNLQVGDAPVPAEQWLRAWNAQDKSILGDVRMSVTDVYRYLIDLGRSSDRAHSVSELHFFSHAWDNGPILANTRDRPDLIRRHPYDADARRSKDFLDPNMSKEESEGFRTAFAQDAIAFVWGCFSAHFTRQYVRQAQDKKSSVVFHYGSCWGGKVEDFDTSPLIDPDPRMSGRSRPMRIGDVAMRLKEGVVKESYMQALALALAEPKNSAVKRHVIGVLPGLGTSWDTKAAPKEPRLMHVPMGAVSSDNVHLSDKCEPGDFRPWLTFYAANIPGLHFDLAHGAYDKRFGRGYTIFPIA